MPLRVKCHNKRFRCCSRQHCRKNHRTNIPRWIYPISLHDVHLASMTKPTSCNNNVFSKNTLFGEHVTVVSPRRKEMCNECSRDNSRLLHQRPERHAHRGLRDDGVPVLHVEPICTRLRKLRVVLQEPEQDDDEVVTSRPESKHVDTCKNKSANSGKRDD